MSFLGHLGPSPGRGRDNETERDIYEQTRPKKNSFGWLDVLKIAFVWPILVPLSPIFAILFIVDDDDGYPVPQTHEYDLSMPPTPPPTP
ncbi:hypothetical protein C8A03DRAFT_32459 [Achaetomium macrosporum]|uniref:Transmembrane protein n=1 Tax=Achaetomium macrosporum TaxID=79813 RepID=A0AAN7HDD8_9PEZI|nr:hypothetical protein C8A03DRAFT_32459 [Achaetomium macrosporum]